MSTARIALSLLSIPVLSAAWYTGTKCRTASATRTGVITAVGESGLFFKTNEMKLQSFPVTSVQGNFGMSLHDNPELVGKAQKFCAQGSFVEVKYDQFLIRNRFKEESTRRVLDINEVKEPANNIFRNFGN